MHSMDIHGLLAQMRTLALQSGLDVGHATGSPAAGSGGNVDFAQTLRVAIDQVDEHMQAAMQLGESFTRGDPGVDLPQVMVAMQKAGLSFRAMNEVRNRLVEAYREMMNLQM